MKIIKVIALSFFLSFTFSNCSPSKSAGANDGSSMEKAIKVKSVDEEYVIVRKLCPQCTPEGQSLVSKGSKHYDVLHIVKPDGEKVDYYFDITSFYGKW